MDRVLAMNQNNIRCLYCGGTVPETIHMCRFRQTFQHKASPRRRFLVRTDNTIGIHFRTCGNTYFNYIIVPNNPYSRPSGKNQLRQTICDKCGNHYVSNHLLMLSEKRSMAISEFANRNKWK
jgi:hypothetical protein